MENSFISLSTASNPLTAALPEHPSASATDQAIARFAISGNALVTGGAGDIAKGVFRGLLQHGLKGLCIFDTAKGFEVSRQVLDNIYAEFPDRNIVEQVGDVADEASVEKAFQIAVQNLGSIDFLLCFAGVTAFDKAEEMTLDAWNKIQNINTTGSWLCAKAAGKQMIKQGTGGNIVFTASIAGHHTIMPVPQSAYAVSKAGILALTRNLAAEWARYGIRVNCISPGGIHTQMAMQPEVGPALQNTIDRTALGRLGLPSEIAGPVIMLCSPAGRYITGTDIFVDGGYHVF